MENANVADMASGAAITPEQKARVGIDRQLEQAGWVVQNVDEMNLAAGKGIAVREMPLAAGHGSADYLLYVDRKPLGVIEAKKEGEPLTGVEVQSEKYSTGLPDRLAAWHKPLPFLYQSTGIETRFTNTLDPDPRSRSVFTFHRPETLLEWVKGKPGTAAYIEAMRVAEGGGAYRVAPPSLLSRLRRMPPLLTAGMRDVQVQAVTKLEASLALNRPRSLIQMTMGSGKTYTAVAQCYRLIKHAGAKRILFLVDRGNLGVQTKAEFDQYVTPDDGRKFTEIYNVQHLKSNSLDGVANVCICTIQRLYSILKGETEYSEELDDLSAGDLADTLPSPLRKEALPVVYNPAIPPEFFDFLVVDEVHRSIYNVWRQVVEYFDSYIVGLTATPSKQTFGFFNGNLVMEYGYPQAVADGVAVDHDIYRIQTKITEQGSTVEAGHWVGQREKRSRRVRWQEQEDDLAYTANQLDRSVVSLDQIRTVIRAFRDSILPAAFPDRTSVPKTLIFAKDDSHADDIVQIVREEFGAGNDFCQKITHKSSTAKITEKVVGADGVEREVVTYKSTGVKPEDLLQQFRNSYHPRVAVTVDMIATGTDIRALEIVFFMRDVKSGNYYEQMKGRGSRVVSADELRGVTGDAEAKTRFVLVDAVGVTEREHTDAPPLDRDPSVPLAKVLKTVAQGYSDADTVSTLAGRMARLIKRLTDVQIGEIEQAAGKPLREIVRELSDSVDPEVQEARARAAFGVAEGEPLSDAQVESLAAGARDEAITPFHNPKFREALLQAVQDDAQTIDQTSKDELLYAGGSDIVKARAAERVKSFKEYIETHRDEITALQVLYAHPYGKGPTYKDLKELASSLSAPPNALSADGVWEAYRLVEADRVKGKTARERVADLVSLVRFAVGQSDTLAPFEETVRERFAAWLAAQESAGRVFTTEQKRWMEMIRDHVAASLAVEADDFEYVPFSELGGLGAAYAAFGDTLYPLLEELNTVLTTQ
jgi:type I restriction enzyme R subunit